MEQQTRVSYEFGLGIEKLICLPLQQNIMHDWATFRYYYFACTEAVITKPPAKGYMDMLFCCCDLDLDPMTLVYVLDLNFLGQGFQKFEHCRQTQIQQNALPFTTPHFLEPMGCTNLHFCGPQPDTRLHCGATDAMLVHHVHSDIN